MKISEYFELGKGQKDLDFVDINFLYDSRLFIDPSRIHIIEKEWYQEASDTIFDFFNHILTLYRNGEREKAKELFRFGREPKETCLGMSSQGTDGRGASSDLLAKIFDSVSEKRLIEDGLIEAPMDYCVFVEDFAEDRMSDLVTNLIRKQLLDYTIRQCEIYNIPLTENEMEVGHYWNYKTNRWEIITSRCLMVEEKKILLVPKDIVVQSYLYSTQKYLDVHVLVKRQEEHLQEESPLTRRRFLKTKDIWVTYPPAKDVIEKHEIQDKESRKDYAIHHTRRHPDLIVAFRANIKNSLLSTHSNKLTDDEITAIIDRPSKLASEKNL
ncbi:hypothetical protein QUF84_21070 [Fictibacillus enclensis]|uniref:hypothetical protein n=1 Tax=Fictibacillus enclensis TaxID=1017270 RepID=UPI0025A1972D|nr:hypothetical protein [Fictibacillus enclensis]MDM5339695.1 hypothetical protein [Fictibacillus enclensis]